MRADEKQNNSVNAVNTSFVPIHRNGDRDAAKSESQTKPEALMADRNWDSVRGEVAPLFALAQLSRTPLPERYPRLTFLAIAVLLLISALTAEFEYLRGAGYSWP